MRTLIKVTVPTVGGNRSLREGTMQRTFQTAIETLRPEASYFYPERGRRCALFVVDLNDSSALPSIAEPFFQSLDAEVEFTPVMNAQELQTGLTKLAR